MFRFEIIRRRYLRSVIVVVWELLRHGLQFMSALPLPVTAMAAEVLFMRKQLCPTDAYDSVPSRDLLCSC